MRIVHQIKTVVVGLFYSAIVPTGLFITAAAMIMLYWVDKYSLLRLWKRPPVRQSLASRLHAFPRAVLSVPTFMHGRGRPGRLFGVLCRAVSAVRSHGNELCDSDHVALLLVLTQVDAVKSALGGVSRREGC